MTTKVIPKMITNGEAGAFFADGTPPIADYLRWPGRIFLGQAALFPGETSTGNAGWTSWLYNSSLGDEVADGKRLAYFETQARFVSSSNLGGIAIVGASRTTNDLNAADPIGGAFAAWLKDNPIGSTTKDWEVWAIYAEGGREKAGGSTWAAEFAAINLYATPTQQRLPFTGGYPNQTLGIILQSGGGNTNSYPADVGIGFVGNTNTFNTAIAIDDAALGVQSDGRKHILRAPTNTVMKWYARREVTTGSTTTVFNDQTFDLLVSRTLNDKISIVVNDFGIVVRDSSSNDYFAIDNTHKTIYLKNLPTSSAGLPAGTVWNDSGTLKIV